MSRRKRRAFSEEFKAEMVRLVLEGGQSIGAVAAAHDLTETSLREWVRKGASPGGLTSEERAELTRLRRELRTVTQERDFLKKAAAFFAKGRA